MSDDNNNEQDATASTDAALFEEFAQLLDEDGNLKAAPTDNEEPEDAVSDPAPSQPTEDGDKPEEVASAPAEPNVFDGLPPAQQQAVAELQANYARVQHSENSNRHRVSALTKKLNALEQAQQAAPPVPEPAPVTKSGEDAQPTTAVDLAQFEEDFPEVFAAIKALNAQEVAPMRQQLNEVTPTINSLNEERDQQVLQAQFDALQTQHPDFREIQESPDFWGWVEGQSDGVKQLVSSRSADDNIVLLDLYKRSVPQATDNSSETPTRPREGDADEGLPRAGVGRLNGSSADGDSWEYWAAQANDNLI